MADFRKALVTIAAHEQGWVNHPDDKGGETYAGITRRDHPLWPGWKIVDEAKTELRLSPTAVKSSALDRQLGGDGVLARLVASLYKAEYWDRLNLDAEPSQAIAEKVVDIAVNMGVKQAMVMLEEARAA